MRFPVIFGAALLALACGQTTDDAGDGSGSGTGGAGSAGGPAVLVPDETIPLLDDERAAEVFAPLADGSCPSRVELQAETLQVVTAPAVAERHRIRVAGDPCGGVIIAWENGEGTVTVERFLEAEVPLWSREVRTVASGKARLLNLAVSKSGAVLVLSWDDEGPTLDIFQADGSPVEGAPEPGEAIPTSELIELGDGSWWSEWGRISVPSGRFLDKGKIYSWPPRSPANINYYYYQVRGVWPQEHDVRYRVFADTPNDSRFPNAIELSPSDDIRKTLYFESGAFPATLSATKGISSFPYSAEERVVLGVTRRSYEEIVQGSDILEWQPEESSDCTATVTSAYPSVWRWEPGRCDLIEAVHGIEPGFLVVHFERREGSWIPHVTLLEDSGRVLDSVSLEDQIPELNPIHNAVGYYRTSVKSAVSADGKTLLLGGLRATGEGFWVGSFRRKDLVACRRADCPVETGSEGSP